MLRPILMLLALLFVSGCLGSEEAGVCDGLAPLVRDHNEALLQDGGDASVVTGERLLAGIDAGCGW